MNFVPQPKKCIKKEYMAGEKIISLRPMCIQDPSLWNFEQQYKRALYLLFILPWLYSTVKMFDFFMAPFYRGLVYLV